MKYYALMDQSLCGPLEAETLATLPNFSRRTLVQDQQRLDSDNSRWTEAGEVPLLAMLMDTRDRGASHARSAAALDAFAAARRANERDGAALKREVVEGVAAQRAALEGAREELARLVARLESAEAALKGIRTALYWGVAVVGAVGLAAALRPRPAERARPAAPEPRPAAVAAPTPSAPAPLQREVLTRPALPVRAAAPAADETAAAVALVKGFPLPASGAGRCARSLDEALGGGGGPARTPQEAVDCRAVARVTALRAALAAGRGWSEEKALGLLLEVMRGRGGFDAAFPPYASARRLGGRTYEVELGRRDLLTPGLSVLLNSDIPAGAAPPLRYEADLAARSVRPRP